ncbi:MAG: BACON domain-containing protein [Bryobacteraceae bacterium]
MKHIANLLSLLAVVSFVLVGNADTALAQGTTLAASPTQIMFTGQSRMASSIPAQTVTVTSTGGAVSFTVGSVVSSGNWLAVTPLAGTTPTQLSVSVTSAGDSLNPGITYPGQFTISAPGVPSINVGVTLNLAGTTGAGVTATPNPVVFNVPAGSTSSIQQQLTISTTGAATSATITASTGTGGNWLSVSSSFISISSVPGTVAVIANPAGLANGSYTGSVTITPGIGAVQVVTVMLNVGTTGTSGLTVTPGSLPTVTVPAGSTAPVNQTLTVTTTSASVSFTAGATTTGAQNWLSVNPPGVQTVTPITPVQLMVSINPTGLAANTYTGSITLTPQGGGTPIVIPVTLVVSGLPALTVTPAMLSFAYQTGTAFPPAQTLTIGSTGGALSFSASGSTSWLVVTPANGGTTAGGPPAVISVQVNPTGLVPNTYTGTITINSNAASNNGLTIPVTLVVSNQPILQLGNSGTTFTYQLGTALPTAQTVAVTSSGNPLTFTATAVPGINGSAFLNVSPAGGTTPQSLSFTLNPAVLAGLGVGTYTQTVNVTAPAAGNSPQSYPVTLIISNSTLLVPSQNALSFNYQIGQSQPAIQTVGVSSTGAPLTYTVAATSGNCGSFLSATPASGTTMAGNVAVSVNTTGLAAGTCMGVISISSATAGNAVNIPVTLFVSATPLLNASPSAINLTTQVGTSPANQTIALTSTDPVTPLNFTVTSTTINGGNWLLVGPTSGATPLNLTVGFTTNGLPVGTYNGSITVTSTGPANSPVVIPVTVVVAPSATASPTPSALTFNQAFGGPAPATQTIQLTSTTAGLNFTTTATTFNGGTTWLSVTPAAGLTPQAVTVTANGTGLAQGSYSGVITFQVSGAANTPVNVPVTLIVGPAQSLVVTPTTPVSFTFQAGSLTTPAAQTVQLTSTGGNVPFTATATAVGGQNLVTVTPASGNTPGPLSIALSQTVLATLAPGSYTSQITIASPNLPSQILNVTVTVTAAAPPSVMSVVNSSSGVPGAVSPGEIITIFGANIGPATPAGLQLTPQGTVSTNVGNTVVLFDGFQAPLTYVSSGQINAIVPYDIAGRVSTNVVVQRNGQSSTSLQLQVVDTAPGIFSLSMGGNGQGAILNSNGTVNGAANPAAKGSVIVIYATGEGVLTPQPPTGSVTSATGPTFPKPVSNVAVTIGGQPAQLLYSGEAPGLVSGVLQVNAVVPQNIGSGSQTVALTVGGATNLQQAITVAIQ